MQFCEHCDNLLYLRADGAALVMHCKLCLRSAPASEERLKAPVFENARIGRDLDDAKFRAYLTPDIRHDITLPRATNVRCPGGCPGGTEVIFAKYDAVDLRFLYFCTGCEAFWRAAPPSGK